MSADPKSKRRWRRRLLIAFTAFVVLLVVSWSGTYSYHWRQREAAIAELKAAGGHVDWESYVAERLKGVAQTPTAFEALLTKHAALLKQYPTLETIEFLQTEKKWEPGVYPQVEPELAALKPLFDDLGSMDSQQPGPLPTLFRAPKTLPDVSAWRGLGRILQMECIDAIGRGDRQRTLIAIKRQLQAARLMRGAPYLIGIYISMAEFGNAHRMIASALKRNLLGAKELADLDERLGELYGEFSMLPSLASETVFDYAGFEDVESLRESLDPTDPMELLGGKTETGPVLLFIQYRYRDYMTSWMGRPQILKAEAAMLNKLRIVRGVIDLPSPWPSDVDRRYRDAAAKVQPLRWGAHGLLESIGDNRRDFVLDAWRSGQRHRRAMLTTRWALRVVRHHAMTGQLPETLDAVCDSRMPTIDVSWMNGKQPIYSRRPDGFTLELPDEILDEYQRKRKEEDGLKFAVTFAANH